MENELSRVVDALPGLVWTALPDGHVDFLNQRWCEYTGLGVDQAYGQGWQTAIHPEDLDGLMNSWQAALAAGEPLEMETRIRRADGKYRWFLARAVPLRDEKRNIVKWYTTTHDIEDRKRTEALLAGEKRVLEMVAKGDALPRILDALCRVVDEHSSDILSSFLLLDANGTHLRHGAAPRLPQSYIDAIDGVAIGPTGGSCITAAHRAAPVIVSDIAADPLWATYRHLPLAHGLRACWSTPIISSEGKVLGTFAMYFREPRSPSPQDLNVLEQVASLAAVSIKHKQAEESLRRSEAYLAESQRLTHVGSSAFDIATGTIVYLSQEHFRMFGFDPEAGMPSFEAARQRLHPEDRDRVLETFDRAINERTDFEAYHRIVLPDGTIKHVHIIAHPAFNASGDLVEYVGTVMDVTERTQAAEVLQRSQNRFRAMVEKNAEGILLILPDKGIIYASPAVERVLGYASDELTIQSLIQHVHLDYRQRATDTWNRLLQDPDHVATAETMLQHKDGSWRWIECTARNLLHDPSVQAVVVNFRDITERKLAQAEHQRLEQRLRQAAKMEAVGRLAGGIAHDFNNVLAGIFAYGEMLVEETPGGSPLKRYARNVLIAATRGRALVEQILGYSRSQRGKRAPVDLGHVVAETLELVRGSLPANIRLEASVPESPLVVMGDATQLHQVVTNLCSNAIQAMSGGGGILRVALETTDVSGERALSHGTIAPGRYVRLTVEDSGSGMDEATLSRIFEPFFTTKEIGQGTGLGLALVYAIVTDAGGAFDVKSAPGRGTTFTIYGPLAEVALAAADDTVAAPPRGNGERVLLVDDEAPLLAATAEVLSRLGYQPVSFSDSHAALSAFEAAPGRFDVVVTDEVMPGLTGTGLASVLRRHRPDLPIVLVSGYSGPLLTQQAFAAGVSELLTKPLQSREIATTLARVLHRAA
jgi:PAS domain S-box-containing protein